MTTPRSSSLQPTVPDSRDPVLTCQGIKKDGTPCRNRRAASASSRGSTPANGGVESPYYCHHHKDQTPQKNGMQANETSVDSLGSQLGRLAVNDEKEKRTVGQPSTRTKKNSRPACFCCFVVPDEAEHLPPSRPTPTVQRPPGKATAALRPGGPSSAEKKRPEGSSSAPLPHGKVESTGKQQQSNQPNTSSRPSPFSSSQPSRLVRVPLIPPQSSLQTGIDISEKLAGAVNAKDEEGFIYLLWELPLSKASEQGLLHDIAMHASPSADNRRRDIRQSLSVRDIQTNHNPPKIRLKIGCTVNVPERLESLRRQCGLNLGVARCYPHLPQLQQQPSSSASPSSSPRRSPARSNGDSQALASGRRVRHFRVVERLIHLELDEQRVRDEVCSGCGKLHREWFEVEATLDALRRVDECVRKWIAWADVADEARPTCFGDLAGKTVLVNRFGLLEYADWIPSSACKEFVQQARSRQ